jgi:hypothetical protein
MYDCTCVQDKVDETEARTWGNERPGSMKKVLKKQARRLQENSEPYIVS